MIIVLYILLAMVFLLNTFFGLGPVLLADGVFSERMLTLAVVVSIYAFIFFVFLKIRKRFRQNSK